MRHCCDCCDNDIERYDVDDLLVEINSRFPPEQRGLRLIYIDDLEQIRRDIEKGNAAEAVWLLDKSIFPKWKELKSCQEAWRRAIAPPAPPAKIGLWQHDL